MSNEGKAVSFRLEEWACGQRLSAGPKAVLKELCRRADMFGVCFPSQTRIAEDTGYSVRTVRRHLNVLEEAGLIEKERRQKGYIRRSDSYMIRAPFLEGILSCGEEEKMAAADADTLSAAEPDKMTGANEQPYKHTDELSDLKRILIFGKAVSTADRGQASNPLWFECGVIRLYRREFEAMATGTGLPEAALRERLEAQAAWLEEQGSPAQRANWLAVTLKYLGIISKSNVERQVEHE